MKIRSKIAVFAVIALVGFAGCKNSISLTEQNPAEFDKEYSEGTFGGGTSSVSVGTGDVQFTITPSINLSATPAVKTAAVTIPTGTVNLDILNIPETETARFEETFKSIFKLYNVNAGGDAGTPNPRGAAINYSVKYRDGNTVYLDLEVSASTSNPFEAVTVASKNTFNNGYKFDKDRDGVAGESVEGALGYDDISVAVAWTGGTAVATPSWWNSTAYWTVSGVPTLTSAAGLGVYSLTYAHYGVDKSDYKPVLDAHLKLQKFDPASRTFVAASGTSAYNAGTYTISFTAADKAVYRVVGTNLHEIKTAKPIYGFIQKLRGGDNNSTNPANLKSSIAGTTQYVAPATAAQYHDSTTDGQIGTNISVYPSVNPGQTVKAGIQIVMDLNANTIGPKGIAPFPGDWARHIKVGYKRGGGSVNSSYDNSWDDVVFIPIEKVFLRSSTAQSTSGFDAGVADQWVIVLKPEYVVNSNLKYIFLSPSIGYLGGNGIPARHFGDTGSWAIAIDGVTEFNAAPLQTGGAQF
jgi:hypothetical protein